MKFQNTNPNTPFQLQLSAIELNNGVRIPKLKLDGFIYGKPLHTAPIILVLHALTGNALVCGENGWWNQLINEDNPLNPNEFTILSFNIPGNGYGKQAQIISNYEDYSSADVASILWKGLDLLGVEELHIILGGSLGGGLAWHLALQQPERVQHLIPVATHYYSNDWIIAQTHVQELILKNSNQPIEDARAHAMLLYRSPESISLKFDTQSEKHKKYPFAVQNWLHHHGEKLKNRFSLASYLLMNRLLQTIDIRKEPNFKRFESGEIPFHIHLVAVENDGLFAFQDTLDWYKYLKRKNLKVDFYSIDSIHGHDAFLIEYEQLVAITEDIYERRGQFVNEAMR